MNTGLSSVNGLLDEIRKYTTYDPQSGKIYWKLKKHSRDKVGLEVGGISRTKNGTHPYRRIKFQGHSYYVHRLIWLLERGEWPRVIDHIDGDTLNNQISNLRSVTQRENCQNRSEHREGHVLGTSYQSDRKKWVAQIVYKKKNISLGRYNTQQEAHEAYLKGVANL